MRLPVIAILTAIGCRAAETTVSEDTGIDSTSDTRTEVAVAIDTAVPDTAEPMPDVAPDAPPPLVDCGDATDVRLSADDASFLAIDATHVYFTTALGDVSKVPRCGGSVVNLATKQQTPLGIAVHGEHVYFANGGAEFGNGVIARVKKTGGLVEPLATKVLSPWAIALDSTAVYWADSYGRLYKRLFDKAGTIDVSSMGGGYAGIALDDLYIYWSSSDVGRVPKAGGGAREVLAAGPVSGWCAAVDATQVFWTEYRGGVFRMPKAGGEKTRIDVAGDQRCLAVDETHVYWMEDGVGPLRAPKGGGALQGVSSIGGTAVAIDTYHVFWSGPGGVFRTRRPK